MADKKQQELSMADLIVGQATATPTASSTRKGAQSLMSRGESFSTEEVDNDIQSYVNMFLDTQRNERATMDYLKETVDITKQDDYEYGLDEQAKRMVDSAEAQYDYSSGEKPPVRKTPELKNAIKKAKSIVEENIGITGDMWDTYRDKIGYIESTNTYSKVGGYKDHYDGYYQMGKSAKEDASKILGYDLSHDAASREAFRNDPALQEEAVAAFTAQNHKYLSSNSSKYRNLPPEEKMAVLAYAHNQGWSGARDWLNSGVASKDAFGTSGTKYYNAIIDAF